MFNSYNLFFVFIFRKVKSLKTMSYTFTYIKPTAVRNNHVGEILSMIERGGFRIVALKKTKFTPELAHLFYGEHEGKEFFERLMKHSLSGSIVAVVLEKDNAVLDFREFIGSTTPEKAKEGTIRKIFGETVTSNAIHGSDSDESAEREMSFFFSKLERF